MFSVYSRRMVVFLIIFAFAAVITLPVHAEANTTTELVIEPFETFAIACNGEEVVLTGELLLLSHFNTDASGGIHVSTNLVPRYVRGVGSETGLTYKAVGGEREHYNFVLDRDQATYTNTSMFNMVSQGGSSNLFAH